MTPRFHSHHLRRRHASANLLCVLCVFSNEGNRKLVRAFILRFQREAKVLLGLNVAMTAQETLSLFTKMNITAIQREKRMFS